MLAELSISHRPVITAAFANLINHCLSNHWWQNSSFHECFTSVITNHFVICICQGLFQATTHHWPGQFYPLLENDQSCTSCPSLLSLQHVPNHSDQHPHDHYDDHSDHHDGSGKQGHHSPCRGTLRARALLVLGCSSDSSNVEASLTEKNHH